MSFTEPEQNDSDTGWGPYLKAWTTHSNMVGSAVAIDEVAKAYKRLPLRADNAIKRATGHESRDLFKIGYMLLIVRERETFTIHDLTHVAHRHWLMPTDDLDLIERVQAVVSKLCRFGDHLSLAGLQNFDHNPVHLDLFLEALANSQDNPKFDPELDQQGVPGSPILSMSVIKAIFCGEIWCVFGKKGRLPPVEEFFGLFKGDIAEDRAFLAKLASVLQYEEVREYCQAWYKHDVEMSYRPNTLKILLETGRTPVKIVLGKRVRGKWVREKWVPRKKGARSE